MMAGRARGPSKGEVYYEYVLNLLNTGELKPAKMSTLLDDDLIKSYDIGMTSKRRYLKHAVEHFAAATGANKRGKEVQLDLCYS